MRTHGRIFTASQSLKRFWQEKSGGVIVYTAFAIPVLLGAVGLAVDAGLWYADKRVVQSAADAAAVAGALEIMRLNQDPDEPDITETDIHDIAVASGGDNGYHEAAGAVSDFWILLLAGGQVPEPNSQEPCLGHHRSSIGGKSRTGGSAEASGNDAAGSYVVNGEESVAACIDQRVPVLGKPDKGVLEPDLIIA